MCSLNDVITSLDILKTDYIGELIPSWSVKHEVNYPLCPVSALKNLFDLCPPQEGSSPAPRKVNIAIIDLYSLVVVQFRLNTIIYYNFMKLNEVIIIWIIKLSKNRPNKSLISQTNIVWLTKTVQNIDPDAVLCRCLQSFALRYTAHV